MHCKRFTVRAVVALALALPVGGSAATVRGDDPPWAEQASFAFWSATPQPPHRIIQPPASLVQQAAPPSIAFHSPPHLPGDSVHVSGDSVHVPAAHDTNRRGHWWQKPEPATVPGAIVEPVWRTPYSYGYFGAARHRHWQRHFGLKQSFTQWTLK